MPARSLSRASSVVVAVLALVAAASLSGAPAERADAVAARTYAGSRSGASDLVVTAVTLHPHKIVRGHKIRVGTTVRNVGHHGAGRSRTGYWLSKDRRKSPHDRAIGTRKLGTIPPGHHRAPTERVQVPANTPPGRWYVLACADAAKKVREKKERNNCGASRSRLTITAPLFPMTAHPLNVHPVLGTPTRDHALAADNDSSEVVTLTAPDGTQYRLSIPRRAIAQDVDLTLTPLTGLDGAPDSGGLVGGLKIEPTGLRLLQPATLTITPPTTPSWIGLTGFRFFDEGADAGMYPLDGTHSPAGSVSLQLSELATYAVGHTTAHDRAIALAHPPRRTDGQFYNVVAPLVPPGSARVAPTDTSVANQYFDDVIEPDLRAAVADDGSAPRAITRALAWSREQAVLGGTDNERIQTSFTLMFKVLANAVHQEDARCRLNHSLADLGLLLANARSYAVLGAGADADSAFDKAQACGHFTLDWSSDITQDRHDDLTDSHAGYDVSAHWAVHTSTIPMEMNSLGDFTGAGTLDYAAFDWRETRTLSCSPGTSTQVTTGGATHPGPTDGFVAVLRLFYNVIEVGSGSPAGRTVPVIRITSSTIGGPSEDYVQTTTDCSGGQNTVGPHARSEWLGALSTAQAAGQAPFAITIDHPGGATVYTHSYVFDGTDVLQSRPSPHEHATTTIVLKHTPEHP